MLRTRVLPADHPAAGAITEFLNRCSDTPGGEVHLLLDGIGTVEPGRRVVATVATTGPETHELLGAGGVREGDRVPRHPVRLSAGGSAPGLTVRLTDLAEPVTELVELVPVSDSVEVLLSAPVGLRQVPVATWNPSTGVLLLGFDPAALVEAVDGSGLRLIHRLVATAAGGSPAGGRLPTVGLLGYGAIGAEHVAGFSAAGFEVVAVCDRSEARLDAARAALPGVRTYAKADELIGDGGVGLVAISTPPDSHARWAAESLRAGHHTVLEKPMALSAADADEVLGLADGAGRLLAVYQNRRFDADFLALRRLVAGGHLGRVFHVEAFVGGYGHPCNYWHSDEAVSGGTAFDWGSHFLDQLLALVPGEVASVRGAAHKLRWHDVTNADHFRIQLTMAGGTEAEFVHSDLAAALKPKWYVLGDAGAAVVEWRSETVIARNAVGLLDEDRLAPADSPGRVVWHQPDGSRTEVAAPPVAAGRWHRELADRLALGEPLTADPVQSRDVVAVLEAAVSSAAAGGDIRRPALRSRLD